MARELAVNLYLSFFRVIFTIFKRFPQKKKTTFVASFGENILCTVKELEKQTDDQVVILKTSHCTKDFNASGRIVLDFEISHVINWLWSIYHLATAHNIIVDNYYGFLAATDFKPNVQCIQLWHAAGAIKKFGLEDPSIKNRSTSANQRFQKVYDRFDSVIVGSDKMASIFKQSFNLTDDNILRTGIPRTDFFFDEQAKQEAKNALMTEYPIIHDKKVMLYAPTYRDDALDSRDVELDIDKMYHAFKHEYVLLLRLHPAINSEFQNKYPGFVINVSGNHSINHLLLITDILITDYSSIPFEFSLLHKPMVFFAYDLEKYTDDRGFWETYEDLVPGPIVDNTSDLVDVIRNDDFDLERTKAFADEWNQYSQGISCDRLIKAIYDEDKQYDVVKQT
ncbi:CDP-glycerol glycerophosphotransferase family protein [Lentibacillus salinarum]|uniref:CDP-glycerol glycerophosphotransferase family protein n=1 Tax=Lentibacillus salinarum TaxID=446820 RepID=A0ABW4A0S5_9BACI